MFELERAKEILKVYQEHEKKYDYNNKDKKEVDEVYDYIAKAFNTLEVSDVIDTRAEIECYIEHSSSRPYIDKISAIYHIYATLIGVLDCRKDYNIEMKKFKESFHDNIDDQYIEKEIENINNYREQLLDDYYSVFSKYNSSFDMEIESFKVNPSHKYFGELCNQMAEKGDHNHIPEFMNSYLFGYRKSMYFDYEEIIERYHELFYKYNIYRTENDNNKKLVKSLLNIK